MTDLFDAIFGYYMVALGAGAFNGARTTLRTAHGKGSTAADAAKFGTGDDAGLDGSPAGVGHRIGERAARSVQGMRRSRAAADVADVAGWVSGIRLYRAAARGAADATERVLTRRSGAPETPDGQTEAGPQDEPAPTSGADPAAVEPTAEPATATEPATGETADGDDLDALARAVTAPKPEPDDGPAPNPERPKLTLVPPIKEYPEIMPAADITDLESLLGFTGQAAGFAGMEAEDALAASASTIAAAEFSNDTARRVGEETQTVEMAIAAMTLLGVDGETAAAYQQLHEAGGVYRDLANKFAAGLQDLAGLAQNMSGAASNYHEAAVAALDTVTREQMPHAEAAQATGHGGADGHFYGVSSTQHVALPNATAGALPAGN